MSIEIYTWICGPVYDSLSHALKTHCKDPRPAWQDVDARWMYSGAPAREAAIFQDVLIDNVLLGRILAQCPGLTQEHGAAFAGCILWHLVHKRITPGELIAHPELMKAHFERIGEALSRMGRDISHLPKTVTIQQLQTWWIEGSAPLLPRVPPQVQVERRAPDSPMRAEAPPLGKPIFGESWLIEPDQGEQSQGAA